MKPADLLNLYINSLKESKKSKYTINTYSIYLWKFIAFLEQNNIDDINSVSEELIENYLENVTTQPFKEGRDLVKRCNATTNVYKSTIRVFFRYLEDNEYIKSDPAYHVKNSQVQNKVGERIIERDYNKIIIAMEKDSCGIRYKAMLVLLGKVGLRLKELISLNIENINKNELTIEGQYKRIIPLSKSITKIINEYLEWRLSINTNNKALFLNIKKDASYRISNDNVQRSLARFVKDANIKCRVTPLILRYSCEYWLQMKNISGYVIKELLGQPIYGYFPYEAPPITKEEMLEALESI